MFSRCRLLRGRSPPDFGDDPVAHVVIERIKDVGQFAHRDTGAARHRRQQAFETDPLDRQFAFDDRMIGVGHRSERSGHAADLTLALAQRARWGLVNRSARDNSRAAQYINAKAETLEQRPTFREAFLRRRCVVPVDGFYEWTGPNSKRQPLWIHPRAGGLMLFAGLYESWYPEKDRPEVTFTIVTCAANAAIAEIHDRMPVVLGERGAEAWMNPRDRDPHSLKRLLLPPPADLLVMRPASPLVNSVKNDGPALLEVGVTQNMFAG